MYFLIFALFLLVNLLHIGNVESVHIAPSTSTIVTLGSDYFGGPQIVSLYINTASNTYFCGGTILNQKTIMTAGHCCKIYDTTTQEWYFPHENILVVAGTDKLNTDNKNVQRVWSMKIHLPTDFELSKPGEPFRLKKDCCIIELKDFLVITENIVEPVKLPTQPLELKPENPLLVCGHGRGTIVQGIVGGLLVGELQFYALMPQLQCGRANAVPFADCERVYSSLPPFLSQESHLCAAGFLPLNLTPASGYQLFSGTGSCQGDSGGPLFLVENEPTNQQLKANVGTQVGIVSAGVNILNECANNRYPNIYTKVSTMLPFINSKIAEINSKAILKAEKEVLLE